jgi:hypothetical protein
MRRKPLQFHLVHHNSTCAQTNVMEKLLENVDVKDQEADNITLIGTSGCVYGKCWDWSGIVLSSAFWY